MRLPLTPRQLEVVELVARGKRYPEIGRLLGISPHTVKNHAENAKDRIGSALPLREALTRWYWEERYAA